MSLVVISEIAEFDSILEKEKETVIAGFFGDFSSASRETEEAFKKFASESDSRQVLFVDVGELKGIHKRYGVSSVPTVISIADGKVIQKIVGKQDEDYYYNAFQSHDTVLNASGDKKPGFPSVTVWVGESCVWCTRVKTYLRKKRVPFREVNISSDPSGASSLQARTGQTGVPQLSIGGRYVVGFDKVKIDEYLGLTPGNGA
ncbi:MAG: glutaredoxin domain-containing protein [Candidatus Fermentibacteria bacterium]|nr:glutaredoxin domain-containing protein [Candidatus Fermentibacteria bacterium]